METDNSNSINRTECITVLSLFDIPTYISEWLYDEAQALQTYALCAVLNTPK